MTRIKKHNLKVWPEFFQEIINGQKTFEVRKNDRDFQTGDIVILREWDPEAMRFTGTYTRFYIGYILSGGFGLEPGYCAFSLLMERPAMWLDETVVSEEE